MKNVCPNAIRSYAVCVIQAEASETSLSKNVCSEEFSLVQECYRQVRALRESSIAVKQAAFAGNARAIAGLNPVISPEYPSSLIKWRYTSSMLPYFPSAVWFVYD
eukprot:scaffold25626_cov137-Cylindrotheca_fusiformis.AAC.10